jgi:chromosome segregation ATPase
MPISKLGERAVSFKGPKSKDTDKIKFFKVEPSGGVTPAFPKDPLTGTNNNAPEMTHAGNEPVFTLDSHEVSLSGEIKIPGTEPLLEKQIDSLKNEVENISQLPDGNGLSGGQIDVLKKYIALKEAEARDLKDQQRQYQAYFRKLSFDLEKQTQHSRHLTGDLETTRRHEEAIKNELLHLKKQHEEELQLLRNDFEERARRSGNYESQVDELMEKREAWREKVKEDLKRIKLKERELENKYELLKRDTQALIDSKDKHVLELKKKNDALELEMESLEERLRHSNTVLSAIEAKKKRLVETMRLAITLLEAIDDEKDAVPENSDERKAG